MTSWSIQPSGVAGVLTEVNTYAEGLGTALGKVSDALGPAVEATGPSPAIGGALQEYFDLSEGPRIQAMSARIQAAASGVVAATEAYVAGDLEMAASAQRASVVAVHSPIPPHGAM